MALPANVCVGEAGVLAASARMLANDILPCRPTVDVGFDIVAWSGNAFWRVQVKTTRAADSTATKCSVRFNVCRRKSGASRAGYYKEVPALRYEDGDVDFFVFVHAPTDKMFVVPASEIAEHRHHVSLKFTSKFCEAWHLLRDGISVA